MSKRIYKVRAIIEFGVLADSESGEVSSVTLNGKDANDLIVGQNREWLIDELGDAIGLDEEEREYERARELENEKKRGGPGRGYI